MDYDLKKALKTAEIVFKRRKVNFDSKEKAILSEIFNLTYRNRRA
jgi:hypothetical protein